MPTPVQLVASPPSRPLMVFDGDCHFCRGWITRWRESTGDAVDYAPLQEQAARFPEIPRAEFEREVKLVEPGGRVTGGAEAVFRTLALGRGGTGRALLWGYQRLPLAEPVIDFGYAFIARHRTIASTTTRLLWGDDLTRPTYRTARQWFLRALAAIYLCAFLSLGAQVDGLIGKGGILPSGDFFAAAHDQLGPAGVLAVPSLSWWFPGDACLHFLCAGGVVLSALLLLDLAPALCLALLWVFYLSLCVAGQTFLSFQWDTLLLETGFLSIFLAPLTLRRARGQAPGGGLLLLRWLLFRLMLMSGRRKTHQRRTRAGSISPRCITTTRPNRSRPGSLGTRTRGRRGFQRFPSCFSTRRRSSRLSSSSARAACARSAAPCSRSCKS